MHFIVKRCWEPAFLVELVASELPELKYSNSFVRWAWIVSESELLVDMCLWRCCHIHVHIYDDTSKKRILPWNFNVKIDIYHYKKRDVLCYYYRCMYARIFPSSPFSKRTVRWRKNFIFAKISHSGRRSFSFFACNFLFICTPVTFYILFFSILFSSKQRTDSLNYKERVLARYSHV